MTPHEEYSRRLQDRKEQQDRLALRERVLGNTRVLVFLAALAMLWMALKPQWFALWWLIVPLLVFTVLLVWHEKVTRTLLRAGRAVAFHERGLARLADRWQGTGQPGNRFLEEAHPYAADLDLFGTGSLFELLCTARTSTGEATLAAWLNAPARPEVIRARQEAVEELRGRLDLREELALLGSNVPHGVDFDSLIAWGKEPLILRPNPWVRLTLFVLGLIAIITVLGWLGLDWGTLPLACMMILNGAIFLCLQSRVQKVIGTVEKKSRDLALLVGVLARLERETFKASRLRELRQALDTEGRTPSERVAQLSNLLDLLSSRKNQLFMPFALLMMWGTQMAYAIEKWRQHSGKAIERWLEVVGEIEALCSLATFAFERDDHPFPEIEDEGPLLDGEELGHPLIPHESCIRNDIRLDKDRQVLVVSGSNMSGKSTMLRTVGINTVLALAGSPVRASRFRVSPLAVGATLRIQDSLQEGKSRFYAELLRVRQVVDLSRGELPLLFLLDEIFHGTNSHDRRQGAEAIVKGLVRAGAIGMVTTHDLTLTHIAESLGERGKNVHFADQFVDGEMIFNYKMQEGVVRNSNAIALMRAVGLEV